jgi:rhodanese-related sulfurtransferase
MRNLFQRIQQRKFIHRALRTFRFKIIDVRDPETYFESHINTSINVPRLSISDWTSQEIANLAKQSPTKYLFLCGSSKNRGPSAAKEFEDALTVFLKRKDDGSNVSGEIEQHQVYILTEGFKNWDKLFGSDPFLTIRQA